MENLYDIWARRNPRFETQFEETLLRIYTDYGVGASELTQAKGKLFGAAYELYIYAFFLGLYKNNQRSLGEDMKSLGQPIQFWGNLDSKRDRKAYPKVREYIFTALIAKTENLDLLALERGHITPRKAVDFLIDTMEKYTNYGFYYILDKINENPNYFYKTTGFLDPIIEASKVFESKQNEEQLESLDD